MLGFNFIKRHKKLQIALIVLAPLLVWGGGKAEMIAAWPLFMDPSLWPLQIPWYLHVGFLSPLITIWEFVACHHLLGRSKKKILTAFLLVVPVASCAIYDLAIVVLLFPYAVAILKGTA